MPWAKPASSGSQTWSVSSLQITSCKTCWQEPGSSRKLTGESEAQLGVVPNNSFSHLDACVINDGLASFSFWHFQSCMGLEGLCYSLLPRYDPISFIPSSLCFCLHSIREDFASLEFMVVHISAWKLDLPPVENPTSR